MLDANLIDPWDFSSSKKSEVLQFSLSRLDERVSKNAFFANTNTTVTIKLSGGIDDLGRHFIDTNIEAIYALVCQRCLQEVKFPINETIRTLLFSDEISAEKADMEEDADVIVVGSTIDICEWVEEQILTSLPLSPMHQQCDIPIDSINTSDTNPFAILKEIAPKR